MGQGSNFRWVAVYSAALFFFRVACNTGDTLPYSECNVKIVISGGIHILNGIARTPSPRFTY